MPLELSAGRIANRGALARAAGVTTIATRFSGWKGQASSASRGATTLGALRQKLAGEFYVELYGFVEFFFAEEFAVGVGDVNGAGAKEKRFAPVGELRNIGGERGGHGFETGEGSEAHVRDVENEFEIDIFLPTNCSGNLLPQNFRRRDLSEK